MRILMANFLFHLSLFRFLPSIYIPSGDPARSAAYVKPSRILVIVAEEPCAGSPLDIHVCYRFRCQGAWESGERACRFWRLLHEPKADYQRDISVASIKIRLTLELFRKMRAQPRGKTSVPCGFRSFMARWFRWASGLGRRIWNLRGWILMGIELQDICGILFSRVTVRVWICEF